MSIERFAGAYTPTCDCCGTELPAEFDFYDAVGAKKQANWHSVKTDFGWDDYCDNCWAVHCWD